MHTPLINVIQRGTRHPNPPHDPPDGCLLRLPQIILLHLPIIPAVSRVLGAHHILPQDTLCNPNRNQIRARRIYRQPRQQICTNLLSDVRSQLRECL